MLFNSITQTDKRNEKLAETKVWINHKIKLKNETRKGKRINQAEYTFWKNQHWKWWGCIVQLYH